MDLKRWVRSGILFVLSPALAASGCNSHMTPPLAPVTAPSATRLPSAASTLVPANVGSVVGFVVDTAFRPLEGATVEVLGGDEAGLSTTADSKGHFVLEGKFDATTPFRASINGHDAVTARSSSPAGQPWILFFLEPLVGAVNIAGDYTLTLVANEACAGLPDEMRTRSYNATVALTPVAHIPRDTYFSVTVHGTAATPQWFSSIGVAGQDLGFDLSRNHDGTPTLVEQVGPDAYLSYRPNNGFTGTRVDGAVSTIATSFDGVIDYRAAGAHVQCESAQHRLVMGRR